MQITPKPVDQTHSIDRRNFLAASAATGLTASVLADQNQPQNTRSHPRHRIVKVILQGGPSQIDLWDLKPNAIGEIRGPFRPISTNVTGIQISECLPRIAQMMDQFTIVRSISGSSGSHDLTQAETGVAAGAGQQSAENQKVTWAPGPCSHNAQGPEPHTTAQTFPQAEALLQAGHKNIVLRFGNWDHHALLSHAIKPIAEQLDQQLSEFIQSLTATELLDQTTILVWGEFGRSPRINAMGGRDHWPAVNSALIAGGPSTRGNVWGATSDDGSHIIDSPISMSELIQQCCHSTTAGLT